MFKTNILCITAYNEQWRLKRNEKSYISKAKNRERKEI